MVLLVICMLRWENNLEGTDAWAVRIYYKPFIRWIWFGAILMSIGGALAISDKRYRFRKKSDQIN